jgi:hypothetical protein
VPAKEARENDRVVLRNLIDEANTVLTTIDLPQAAQNASAELLE